MSNIWFLCANFLFDSQFEKKNVYWYKKLWMSIGIFRRNFFSFKQAYGIQIFPLFSAIPRCIFPAVAVWKRREATTEVSGHPPSRHLIENEDIVDSFIQYSVAISKIVWLHVGFFFKWSFFAHCIVCLSSYSEVLAVWLSVEMWCDRSEVRILL